MTIASSVTEEANSCGTNVPDIDCLVTELKEYLDSPLKQLVLEAYDLYQLLVLISNNSKLYNKLINLLDNPPTALNENIQTRHNILKRFVECIPLPTISKQLLSKDNQEWVHNNTIEYIVIDNIIVAIRKMLAMVKSNSSVQIVVSDHKIRNLIECAMGVKRQQHSGGANSEIVKLLHKITFLDKDATVIDISHIKYNCDYTFFFNINPDIEWTNNVGHLWLSGRERELIGLTKYINWQQLLRVSPNVYIFNKEKDIPQWQRIQTGRIEKIEIKYPQVHHYEDEPILNECTELTINTAETTDLLHNPYLLYLKGILQLKPKRIYTDNIGKIYDTFFKVLCADMSMPLLDRLKEIDYFYYKKIQSFIRNIPHWKYPLRYASIGTLTIVYNDNPQVQNANITEINYFTLNSSISAKDIICSKKTSLMLQALSAENNIQFNIISPDWHSNNGTNKRTIEASKEVVHDYKERIVSAWNNFKQSNVLELNFDLDATSASYKHLERVK